MFDKYLLVDGTARAVLNDGNPALEVDARIAYYRGLGLSMVEDVSISIDGVTVAREDTTFVVHGNSYSLDEMESVVDDRWGFTEAATVRVRTAEVVDGDHVIGLTERLRISYIPMPTVTSCTKTMTVRGP